MTTIFERVNDALETLSPSVPFGLAPYLSASGSLPDTFITFQLIVSPPAQHADDAETQRYYLVQVSTWDVTGLVSLPNVDAAMLAAGFEKSTSRQLPKDEDSGHFGLATDFVYLDSA